MFPFGIRDAITLPQRPNLTSSSTLHRGPGAFPDLHGRQGVQPAHRERFWPRSGPAAGIPGPRHGPGRMQPRPAWRNSSTICSTAARVPCSQKSLERRITTLKVFFWLAGRPETCWPSIPPRSWCTSARNRPCRRSSLPGKSSACWPPPPNCAMHARGPDAPHTC